MEDKLKNFIEEKLESAEKYAKTADDVINIRAQAFGAFIFCVRYEIVENREELDNYWDEIWLTFHRIAKRKGENNDSYKRRVS